MKLFSILLLLSAGVCMAQVTADKTTGCFSNADGSCAHSQPAPLKCGKYEHVEQESCPEGRRVCTLGAFSSCECQIEMPKYCAPDLHTVTEKEWQEIMRRLKKLESK